MDEDIGHIGRQVKGLTDGSEIELWSSIDIAALSEEDRQDFLKRKSAILKYLRGDSYEEIRAQCTIGPSQIYRLITERCLAIHSDGRPFGWRALIRNQNLNGYNRKKPIVADDWGLGTAGVLGVVFQRYPQIRIDFEKRILRASSEVRLTESKKPRQALWQWLLAEFRRVGMEARAEWPFTTKHLGYASIRRFIERTMQNSPEKATAVFGGADLAKKAKAGDGTQRPVLKLFQRVEVDAHKLDGRFCIMIPQLDGDATPKIVHRLIEMRIRSIELLPTTSDSSTVAWGQWALKDYQSIWLTMHRFVMLNGPSREAFDHDFCGEVRKDSLKKRPWLVVPGEFDINLASVAKLFRRPVDSFRFSHLQALPQRDTLFLSHLRFCHSCLEEGYHTCLMSLKALTHCPIHDEDLEDRCDCGEIFSDGIGRKIINHPGQCPCGASEMLSLTAARSPTIQDNAIEVFDDLTEWLMKCGARIFLHEVGGKNNGLATNDAINYWANSVRTIVPYEYTRVETSHPDTQVIVHNSSKTIASLGKSVNDRKYPKSHVDRHRHHQRNLMRQAYADPPYVCFRAICRYIRRHVLPEVKKWELEPKWHVYARLSTMYVVPPRLVKAYVFFQMYGGHSNFARAFGRTVGLSPYADPESVSPFAREWVMASAPHPLQHPEGARWLHERAEADYLWISWKQCVARALAGDARDVTFLWQRPQVENSIKHWSAGYKAGRYVLRIEAVRYPSVAVRRRRLVSKEIRRKQLDAAALEKFERIMQELPPTCLRFSHSTGWGVGAGTLPSTRPVGKWFKKKELYFGSSARIHYVIFPKNGQYVARSFEKAVEVVAATSYEALSLLKAGLERTLKLTSL